MENEFENETENQYNDVPGDGPVGYPYVNRPGSGYIPVQPSRVYEMPNNLAKAAMVLGILSLLTIFTVYLPLILGSLAVILAILSRGSRKKMHGDAKTGVITGTISLCIVPAIVAASFYLVFTNPSYYEQFNDTYEKMYGRSFDDTLKGIKDGTIDYDDIYGDIY